MTTKQNNLLACLCEDINKVGSKVEECLKDYIKLKSRIEDIELTLNKIGNILIFGEKENDN